MVKDQRWRAGIDLGGTKIESVLINPAGQEVFRRRIPTEQRQGYKAILLRIQRLYVELTNISSKNPVCLGVATPGSLSIKNGLLKNSNTLCLNAKPLLSDLQNLLKRPLRIENDANCFALAEARYGAGAKAKLVFGVILGTGCGGGIVLNGQLWDGLQAIGGEWGHMSIDPRGPLCYCGSRGCVETLISGSGLQNIYKKRFGRTRSVEKIMLDFEHGQVPAKWLVHRFMSNYGRSMANLINVLDPNLIVLGGGLSNIPELYTLGYDQVKRFVFSDTLETPIVKNELGDSAGVLGAALLGI